MAKILNKTIYPSDYDISAEDYLIGTDGNNNKRTKTYPVSALKSFILGTTLGGLDGVGVLVNGVFTWLKFADDVNGLNMSDSPIGKLYIGVAFNKEVQEESDDPTDYFWNLIEGDISYIGADGKTYYIWAKYSNSADGSAMSNSPIGMSYIGLAYHKETPIESDIATDYEWSLFLGSGILQQPVWLFYWVKFADDINGLNMSDSPDGKLYMGIGIDKLTQAESDDPTDYVWNLITESQSYVGADGKTYYIWVKYALTKTSATLVDDPTGMTYMGIAIHKTVETESENYLDYTWSEIELTSIYEQDNIISVVNVPISTFSEQAIADWVNANGITVSETENIIFSIGENATDGVTEEPPYEPPTLDLGIPLTLILTGTTATTASFTWVNA